MVHAPHVKTFDAVRADLHDRTIDDQLERNASAIARLEAWLADESGYDEDVWPRVRATLIENRLSDRSPFSE